MKYVPRMPIPWDMVVFLTITTAGFGFSVHRLVTENPLGSVHATVAREPSTQRTEYPLTADLGCLERSLPKLQVESQHGSIRLRGKICNLSAKSAKNFQGVQVRNLTNGFEGTVFLQGKDPAFVTDYVILEKGRNEIQVEWKDQPLDSARRIVAEVFEK